MQALFRSPVLSETWNSICQVMTTTLRLADEKPQLEDLLQWYYLYLCQSVMGFEWNALVRKLLYQVLTYQFIVIILSLIIKIMSLWSNRKYYLKNQKMILWSWMLVWKPISENRYKRERASYCVFNLTCFSILKNSLMLLYRSHCKSEL